ncbi:SCO6745 family protein [Amycolatopsis sp. H20-H5]|uniref:SCO6745 family protein n=1 Tax=Amycolatopsis sp. H20-H5 TaxID=3046309 RepID=UPI002DB67E1D|nr:hypothetical protein [Amycolatopsis sp. H20-H5]MEC3979812.1 hypothetical protein [Amycolatopsis sp. H20-H5]
MNYRLIGQAMRRLQIYAAMVYFSPEYDEELMAAGLEPGVMCYFGGRAAAMGAVPASVIHAAFYNFNPERVRENIPKAWTLASPEKLLEARLMAADRALKRLLGSEVLGSPQVAEAAGLARRAAMSAATEGRPLAASHQELDWPDSPHLVLWQGLAILREHRGDGHIAALINAELGGLQSMVSHAATGSGFLPSFAQSHRGWSGEQWNNAAEELRVRGVLDADGALTEQGTALRAGLEEDTDRLAAGPWRVLGDAGAQQLAEIGGELSTALVAAGCLPAEDVFFPAKR